MSTTSLKRSTEHGSKLGHTKLDGALFSAKVAWSLESARGNGLG